jgi:predicted ATPase
MLWSCNPAGSHESSVLGTTAAELASLESSMPVVSVSPGRSAPHVVLTGGPGSGKTTLLEHFRSLGYPVVPEAALHIIQELVTEMGMARQKAWRRRHVREFQERILARQIRMEMATRSMDAPYVFLDRGRLDGLAYFRLSRVPVPAEMAARITADRYATVFVLDTLPNYRARTESGRATETYTDSLRIRRALMSVYERLRYQPIPVPVMTVEERAAFVLDRLTRNG